MFLSIFTLIVNCLILVFLTIAILYQWQTKRYQQQRFDNLTSRIEAIENREK